MSRNGFYTLIWATLISSLWTYWILGTKFLIVKYDLIKEKLTLKSVELSGKEPVCTVEEIASYADILCWSNAFDPTLLIERFWLNAFNRTLSIERFQSNAFDQTLSIECFQSNAFNQMLPIKRFQSNAFNQTLSIERF